MVGKTFVVEKICPVCEKSTRVVKTRSRINVLGRDEDGFVRYEDFNPYYYTIWICEHCGFAADEKTFTSNVPNRYLKILRNVLLTRNIKIPFTAERTLGDATTSFRLALKYLEIIHGKSSKRAKYAHQMAWLFREAGDTIQEAEFMNKAAEFYEDALATERFPIDALTDNTVIYLLAAIYCRLGDKKKATLYLSKIMSDQEIRSTEPRIFDRARDLWGEIRAEKRKSGK